MDLIRMTDKNPLLTIRLGRESHFKYKSNIYSSELEISTKEKRIIPKSIMSLFNKFLVNTYYAKYQKMLNYIINSENEYHPDEYLFLILSELIEHVLQSNGDKELMIVKTSENPSKLDDYETLIRRIQLVFGQRKHFENIMIEV